MEAQTMVKMILQQMILGSEVLNITACAIDGRHAQPAGGVSASGKQFVPPPYDPLMDVESIRLMEERYGITDEGLF
jgi:hypothetical protein